MSVAEKAGVLEAGNEAQHAGLLAEFQVVLEADQVVGVGAQVFLPQLDDGVGHLSGARIVQADGFHGAEAQRVAAAAGDFFDGQAAFEVVEFSQSFASTDSAASSAS